MRAPSTVGLCRVIILTLLLATGTTRAQNLVEWDADLTDRPIAEIVVNGAEAGDDQLIRNNIRASIGDPYDGQVVRADVDRVYHLGRFKFVTAEVRLNEDGDVSVIYSVTPEPLIKAIQTKGNKAVNDQELRGVIRQVVGGPADPYLIEKAKRDIQDLYRDRGFYLTNVSIDELVLDEGVLLFNVIEGPRVRIKGIEFEGAHAFPVKRLYAEVSTRKHMFIFRAGVLAEDAVDRDKAALDQFYKDRGYLDVRIGHRIELSPDNKEVKVVFLIDEGRRYTLRNVLVERRDAPGLPLEIFTDEQISAMLEIKSGDVYSRDKLDKSVAIIQAAFGELGHLNASVVQTEIRMPEPQVDLLLEIDEGEPARVGIIQINGNFLTRDKVIRRLIRLQPGRPFNAEALQESELDLRQTRLFNDVRLTVQEPEQADPLYRDLLVEIKERDTGSVNFGLAVGSDSGLFGEFSIIQNNFDILDVPTSFRELLAGRAFRGGGQRFSMVFRPGDEIFEYSISLTEPHILESEYALSMAGFIRSREFDDYDEERLGGSVGLTRSLGDIWQLGFSSRWERVKLDEIVPDAPLAVFASRGPDTLAGLSARLTRTTVNSFFRPDRGSRFEASVESLGLVTGDLEFWKVQSEYAVFIGLDEDFLGRKTVLRLNSRVGYIFGQDTPPTYERFYLGGRSFRGFRFRDVSPKGIAANTLTQSDKPVGGEWLLFFGGQLEFPLMQESITGVAFVDSGTVTQQPGFDDYRVSVGVGLRLYLPALGPAPIAFDFGFPVVKQDLDRERVFSFSAELPF